MLIGSSPSASRSSLRSNARRYSSVSCNAALCGLPGASEFATVAIAQTTKLSSEYRLDQAVNLAAHQQSRAEAIRLLASVPCLV